MRLIVNYSYYTNLMNLEQTNYIPDEIVENPSGMMRDQAMQIADKYSKLDNIEFKLDNTPIKISENQLLKITEELVDNACKFSPPGAAIRLESESNGTMLMINIINHGRGMTDEQIESIGAFMQFERKTYEQQGMGLGLAIVKKIADINDGHFSITSEAGKETVVRVKLPLAN
jgi:signal transduction histidine kinase